MPKQPLASGTERRTRIEYLYRDGSNWKFRGDICLLGQLSLQDIEPLLLDGLWFVPQAVGLASLTPEVRNQDDHCLHEFVSLTGDEECSPLMTTDEFLSRLKEANRAGWLAQLTW